MHGKEGMSSAWLPSRGLREGCSTPPPPPFLFNIYHQAVLRQVGEAMAAAWESEVGIKWRWIPGSSFAVTSKWERNGSEAKEVRFQELLFANDTTIVGKKEEIDGGVNAMKEVMGKLEERSNDQKEECLDFWKRVTV